MNTAVRGLTYVGVLVIGGAIGAYVGWTLAKSQAGATEMAEVAYYSVYLQTQRAEGDDAAYEDALRMYLKNLESRRRAESGLFSDRVYDFDSALSHTRLSALASKRGAKSEADEHLRHAMAYCAKAGWRDCSEQNLFSVAQRLDKSGPLATKGAQ